MVQGQRIDRKGGEDGGIQGGLRKIFGLLHVMDHSDSWRLCFEVLGEILQSVYRVTLGFSVLMYLFIGTIFAPLLSRVVLGMFEKRGHGL